MRTRVPPSTYTQDQYYAASDYKSEADYPPMPAYSQGYGLYNNPSQTTFIDDTHQIHAAGAYDDDIDGKAHLTSVAAPMGVARQPSPGPHNFYADPTGVARQPSPGPHNFYADPHDVYQGRAEPDWRTPAPQPQMNMGGEYMGGQAYGEGYLGSTGPSPPQNWDYAYGGTVSQQQGEQDPRRWHPGGTGYV